MRKLVLLAFLLLCVACTGCMNIETTLTISEDGKVSMHNKFVAPPEGSAKIEELKNKFANNPDAKITPVKEEDVSGYEIDVKYPSIEAFAAEKFTFFSAREGRCAGIQQHKGLLCDTYNFDLIAEIDPNLSPEEAEQMKSAIGAGFVNVYVKLPHSAEKTNAYPIDPAQKELSWNLDLDLGKGKEVPVQFTFKIWHTTRIYIILAIMIALLVAGINFNAEIKSAANEEIAASITKKRNICLGLFVVLLLAFLFFGYGPVTFTPADTISQTIK